MQVPRVHPFKSDTTTCRYLECISRRGQLNAAVDDESNEEDLLTDASCEDIRPEVPQLDAQQISGIAVLERCKSNYQQKQWDVGAYLLYNSDMAAQLITGSVIPPTMDNDMDGGVGSCLLRAERNKESNVGCLTSYLGHKYRIESTPSVYWRYEKVFYTQPVNGKSPTSDDTDACIVFSGPAKRQDNSSTTMEFRKCSHDYTDTGCSIPHMVWSSSSNNKIPVATLHTVEETNAEDREETARAMFAEAHKAAIDALTKLENFTDVNLEVVLFSGEGDALHQVHALACFFHGHVQSVIIVFITLQNQRVCHISLLLLAFSMVMCSQS
jgi:hypothetical protein